MFKHLSIVLVVPHRFSGPVATYSQLKIMQLLPSLKLVCPSMPGRVKQMRNMFGVLNRLFSHFESLFKKILSNFI